ncbi:MAG: gamma-glutamylcyclotransferase family protein [Patescibacteria group bacterium]|jgi:hypothetical protein
MKKIIAYGSLLDSKSRQKTIPTTKKLTPLNLKGYERIFNAPFKDRAYLNMRKNPDSEVQVAYFKVNDSELDDLISRESGSDLVEVANDCFAFIWPEKKSAQLPVYASYIKVCERGAAELGINFWQGTIEPVEIIDDLTDPKYPNYAE